MSDNELLPCPFCGSDPKVENTAETRHERRMTVGCSNENCFAYLPHVFFARETEAIAAWNRRATLTAPAVPQGWQTMDSVPKDGDGMTRHAAYYTFDQEAWEEGIGALYYFAPADHAPGPFTKQIHVDAIIDIDRFGRLAGIELIENMPLPPLPASPAPKQEK